MNEDTHGYFESHQGEPLATQDRSRHLAFAEVVPFYPALPDDKQEVQVFIFHPRGRLLRARAQGPITEDSLLIEEAEVPRAGAFVERRFNYARTADGKAWLWVGRKKRVGRGEASSGLRFDGAVRAGQY